jgi:hypothetical protein
MPIPAFSVLAFVWQYVIPIIKDIAQVLAKGTYSYVKGRVDDLDVLAMKGIEKRTRVFEDASEFLKQKGVDTSLYSSAAIYLLIEIAVVNLKKQQKKLVK